MGRGRRRRSARRIRLGRALLGLALAASASASDAGGGSEGLLEETQSEPDDLVRVRDFYVIPAARLDYSQQTLRLHPKALLGVGYDTNVNAASTGQKRDEFGEALVGLDGRCWLGPNQRLMADGEVDGRGYLHEQRRDLVSLRLRAQYDLDQSEAVSYRGTASYGRIDDPLVETGRPVDRGETAIGAQGYWTGMVTRALARLDYRNQTFFENDPAFNARARSSNTFAATIAGGYATGSASEYQLRFVAARQDYAGDGAYQDNTQLMATAGWKATLLTRISFTAEAGAQALLFADDFNHDHAYDDKRAVAPVFSVLGRWDPEPLSYLSLALFRRLEPSAYSNSVDILGAECYLRYRLLLNAAALGGLRAYRYDSSGAAAGVPIERREVMIALIGGEYYLREGVVARLTASEEDNHAKVGSDFSRLVLRLEIGAAY